MTDYWGYAVAAAKRLRPDFEPIDLLQHPGKSVVIGGAINGRPVVVKVLFGGDRFWADKFVHEIVVSRAFARQMPPIPVARLIDADEQADVLIIERLADRPLAVDRYPAGPLPAADVTAVVDAVATLADWQPPPHLPISGTTRSVWTGIAGMGCSTAMTTTPWPCCSIWPARDGVSLTATCCPPTSGCSPPPPLPTG